MTGPESPWQQRVAARRQEVIDAGLWRAPRIFDGTGQVGTLASGAVSANGRQTVVSFGGNDYLGLSNHPAVVEAARAALEQWGVGAGGSRLLTGTRPVHVELEQALAEWKGTERAVVFPTGYAANLGVLTTFGEAGVLVCSDERNHASIIDGARLARSGSAVFAHGDLDHLARLLGDAPELAIVASDAVFSMDGDEADVVGLAQLCRRHGALLVLDEAHAVLGPTVAPEVFEDVDVLRIGTLSKSLGALGGFVAGSTPMMELVENRARPYIFTTGSPPAMAAAALAALAVVRSPEGAALRDRLVGHVRRVAKDNPSPIVPVVLGPEAAALAASESLLRQGLWVPAIRPPTVPKGTSRLRVALSAAHTDAQVTQLVRALADLGWAGSEWPEAESRPDAPAAKAPRAT